MSRKKIWMKNLTSSWFYMMRNVNLHLGIGGDMDESISKGIAKGILFLCPSGNIHPGLKSPLPSFWNTFWTRTSSAELESSFSRFTRRPASVLLWKGTKSAMGTSVISELRPARSGNSVYVTPHSAISDPSRVPARTISRLNIVIGGMDRLRANFYGLDREWTSPSGSRKTLTERTTNNVVYSKSTTAGGAVLRKSN